MPVSNIKTATSFRVHAPTACLVSSQQRICRQLHLFGSRGSLTQASSARILHDLGKPLNTEEQRLDDFTLLQQSLSLTNQSHNGPLMDPPQYGGGGDGHLLFRVT